MHHSIIGNRTGEACFLRLPVPVRMGDLCSLRLLVSEWRYENPLPRLSVTFDGVPDIHCYSRQIPLEWVFDGLADEVLSREHIIESFPNSIGKRVLAIWNGDADVIEWRDPEEKDPTKQSYSFYNPSNKLEMIHMWTAWRMFMFNRKTNPVILPPDYVTVRAAKFLHAYGVPRDFMVVQPLCEAGYHRYRNSPKEWWEEVSVICAQSGIPIVVLGPTTYLKRHNFKHNHPLIFPLFKELNNPFDSVGVISLSKGIIGGETGLPLWSAMMKIPVVSALREWGRGRDGGGRVEYRPISFGAPVVFGSLDKNPRDIAAIMSSVFEGKASSTPRE